MIDEKLLKILSCPINRTPLRVADEEAVARLNRAIAAKQVKYRSGREAAKPFDGGLLNDDGTLFYPIVDGIPILVPDEAIVMSQISS